MQQVDLRFPVFLKAELDGFLFSPWCIQRRRPLSHCLWFYLLEAFGSRLNLIWGCRCLPVWIRSPRQGHRRSPIFFYWVPFALVFASDGKTSVSVSDPSHYCLNYYPGHFRRRLAASFLFHRLCSWYFLSDSFYHHKMKILWDYFHLLASQSETSPSYLTCKSV